MSVDNCGNIELLTYKYDLIYDKKDKLVEHWIMERIMTQHEDIKGVQVFFLNLMYYIAYLWYIAYLNFEVVQICAGAPIVVVFVAKYSKVAVNILKSDLILLCREHNV